MGYCACVSGFEHHVEVANFFYADRDVTFPLSLFIKEQMLSSRAFLEELWTLGNFAGRRRLIRVKRRSGAVDHFAAAAACSTLKSLSKITHADPGHRHKMFYETKQGCSFPMRPTCSRQICTTCSCGVAFPPHLMSPSCTVKVVLYRSSPSTLLHQASLVAPLRRPLTIQSRQKEDIRRDSELHFYIACFFSLFMLS